MKEVKNINFDARDAEFYRRLWKLERRNHLYDLKMVRRRWITSIILVVGIIGTALLVKSYLGNRLPLEDYCPEGYMVSSEYVAIESGDTMYSIMAKVRNDAPIMTVVPKPAWKQAIMQSNDMTFNVEADCINTGEYLRVPIFVQKIDPPEFDEFDF